MSTEQVIQIVQYCLGTVVTVDSDVEKLARAAKLYIDDKQQEGDEMLKDLIAEPILTNQLDINKDDLAGKISQALVRLAYLLSSQDNITCIVALNPE